ncbi:MAG: hypothetical protein AB7S26_12010 [Sandaracinaceae bacterium]
MSRPLAALLGVVLLAIPVTVAARVAPRRPWREVDASVVSTTPTSLARTAWRGPRISRTLRPCFGVAYPLGTFEVDVTVRPDGHPAELHWTEAPPEWAACVETILGERRVFGRTRAGGTARLRFVIRLPPSRVTPAR